MVKKKKVNPLKKLSVFPEKVGAVNGRNFVLVFKAGFCDSNNFDRNLNFEKAFWQTLFQNLKNQPLITHFFAILLTSSTKIEHLFIYIELQMNSRKKKIIDLFPKNYVFELFQRNNFKTYVDKFNISKDFVLSQIEPKKLNSTVSLHLFFMNLQKNFSLEDGPFFSGLCHNAGSWNIEFASQDFVKKYQLFNRIDIFFPKRWEDSVLLEQPDSVLSEQPDSVLSEQPDSVLSEQPDSVLSEQPDSNFKNDSNTDEAEEISELLSKDVILKMLSGKKKINFYNEKDLSLNLKYIIKQLKEQSVNINQINNLQEIVSNYIDLDYRYLDPLALLRNCALIIFIYKKQVLKTEIHWTIQPIDYTTSVLEKKSIISILKEFNFVFEPDTRAFIGFDDKRLNKFTRFETYHYENLTKYINSKAMKHKLSLVWNY